MTSQPARWKGIRPNRGAPVAPCIFDFEGNGAHMWFAVCPVTVPPHTAAQLNDEKPVMVRDVPRVATTTRAVRLKASCTVALLRQGATPILVLRGEDADEILALVSLVDGDAAEKMASMLAGIEGGEVVEVKLTTQAAVGAAIFGGGG